MSCNVCFSERIKLQKAAIPLKERQILSTEKFEDRPMSPETWDDLTLLPAYQTAHAVL